MYINGVTKKHSNNSEYSKVFIIILFLYGDGEYTLCDVASSFEGEFYFYTYQNIEFSNCNQIVNGNGYILKTDTKSAKIIYNQLDKSLVKGFSFCVSENQLNAYISMYVEDETGAYKFISKNISQFQNRFPHFFLQIFLKKSDHNFQNKKLKLDPKVLYLCHQIFFRLLKIFSVFCLNKLLQNRKLSYDFIFTCWHSFLLLF